jgi:hypothetical protein
LGNWVYFNSRVSWEHSMLLRTFLTWRYMKTLYTFINHIWFNLCQSSVLL